MNDPSKPPAEDVGAPNPHDPLAEGFPPTLPGRLLFWLAVAFSAFQVATAAHLIDFPSQVVRAIHVGFLMALAFPLLAVVRREGVFSQAVGWLMALLGVAVAAYQWIEHDDLLLRAGDPPASTWSWV